MSSEPNANPNSFQALVEKGRKDLEAFWRCSKCSTPDKDVWCWPKDGHDCFAITHNAMGIWSICIVCHCALLTLWSPDNIRIGQWSSFGTHKTFVHQPRWRSQAPQKTSDKCWARKIWDSRRRTTLWIPRSIGVSSELSTIPLSSAPVHAVSADATSSACSSTTDC